MHLYWNERKSEWQVGQRSGVNRLLRSDYLFNPLRFKRTTGLPQTFLDGRIDDDKWKLPGYHVLSINTFHLDQFTRFTRSSMPRANILMMDGSVRSFRCAKAYDELTRLRERGTSWRNSNWSDFESIVLSILTEEER